MSRTLKDILADTDSLRLQPWQEYVGEFAGLCEEQGFLIVEFSKCRLRFNDPSPSAEILRDELAGVEGRRVTILRTDLPDRPVVIKID